MSIYAVIPIVALILNIILVIYILYKNAKKIESTLFAFILIFFILWDIGEIMMRVSNNINVATIGSRLFLSGGFLSAPVYLVFTLYFPKKNRLAKSKILMGVVIVLSTVIMSLCWFTGLIIQTVEPFPWGFSPSYGSFFPMAALLHLCFTVAGIVVLGITYKNTKVKTVRNRAKFVIIGTIVPIIFGSPSNVIYPLIGISSVELASAFTVGMGGFIAYAILRYKVLVIPVTEDLKPTKAGFNVKRGLSYLIEEEKPETSYGVFMDAVTHGAHGLCVTRIPPETIRTEFGLQKTPIIWLSRTVDDKMCIDPAMTAELSMTIKDFIEESENGVVLLDGLEYLIVHNNFNKILKLIHDINEAIAVHQAILIIPVDRRILNEKEYALLERDIKKLPSDAEYHIIPTGLDLTSESDLFTV
jgi:hypothetical protein